MATIYADTSALGRVLLSDPSAPAVQRTLSGFGQLVASRLLRVELRRLGVRSGRLVEADQLASRFSLLPISEDVLALAETLEPSAVGTLDAIHLATAVRLAAGVRLDALMTYDKQLAAGARHHGIRVLMPA